MLYHSAPRCLLGLFDAASTGLADWSEFHEEAARLRIEVRGLSREDLSALIAGSTHEIPTTEHRRLHQEGSDFVRWGRRGAEEPWLSTAVLLAARPLPMGARPIRSLDPAPCLEFKWARSLRPAPRVRS
jgi:hypothetical protein